MISGFIKRIWSMMTSGLIRAYTRGRRHIAKISHPCQKFEKFILSFDVQRTEQINWLWWVNDEIRRNGKISGIPFFNRFWPYNFATKMSHVKLKSTCAVLVLKSYGQNPSRFWGPQFSDFEAPDLPAMFITNDICENTY